VADAVLKSMLGAHYDLRFLADVKVPDVADGPGGATRLLRSPTVASALVQALSELSPAPDAVFVVMDGRLATDKHPYELEDALGRWATFWHVLADLTEETKGISTVEEIWRWALGNGVTRRSVMVALGGGVVGDATGFAAATTLRGLRCIQIPTTILAQADSALGGKTGINLGRYKNSIGAFAAPVALVLSGEPLATLPPRVWRSGLAETIKCAALVGDSAIGKLCGDAGDLAKVGTPTSALDEAIAMSQAVKAAIVQRDPFETLGLRRVLNQGHTIAHAIEAATGFLRIMHGEAVALGLLAEALLAEILGTGMTNSRRDEWVKLIGAVGLPTRCETIAIDALIGAMLSDKKSERGTIGFLLPGPEGEAVEAQLPPDHPALGIALNSLFDIPTA